jgi:hypothetical protein
LTSRRWSEHIRRSWCDRPGSEDDEIPVLTLNFHNFLLLDDIILVVVLIFTGGQIPQVVVITLVQQHGKRGLIEELPPSD